MSKGFLQGIFGKYRMLSLLFVICGAFLIALQKQKRALPELFLCECEHSLVFDRKQTKIFLSFLEKESLLYMRDAGRSLQKLRKQVRFGAKKGRKVSRHYPKGDVWDPKTGCQYYYHTHRPMEEGHFHLFFYPTCATESKEPYVHLLAISVGKQKEPLALFALNQWVAGGDWYTTRKMAQCIKRFRAPSKEPSEVMSQWIDATLTLFYPQILAVLSARDHLIDHLEDFSGQKNARQDRSLEIVSAMPISVDVQLEIIEELLRER